MITELGVPPLLVSRLKEKKRLLEANDKKHTFIKTALIIDGGAMKGVFAAGVIAALKELGFENIFDIVIAVSSGTLSASYLLSGEGDVAPKVFYEDLASKQFINLWKLHPMKIVGIDYSNTIFLQKKPIKQNTLRQSRSQFYIGVTDPDTAKTIYLDMKKGDVDILAAMNASSAIPLLHNKMVTIYGKQYLDGMISSGIPITPALEMGCTDILIIENMPYGKPNFIQIPFLSVLFSIYKFQVNPAVKKAIFERTKHYFETIEEIRKAQKKGITIGIIAPSKPTVDAFSINSKLLRQTAEEAKRKTLQIFS